MVENEGRLTLTVESYVKQYDFYFRVLENEQAWEQKSIMKSSAIACKNHKPHASQSAANLRIDFGMICPVTDVRIRTLKIQNRSAIQSNYSIVFKNFNPNAVNVEETQATPKRFKSGFLRSENLGIIN